MQDQPENWRYHPGQGCRLTSFDIELSAHQCIACAKDYDIMLAAATRCDVGLAVVLENGGDPEGELVMLEELLLSRFTNP